MTADDNEESEILQKMFDEVIKMIRGKQIKLESIIQGMIEVNIIPEDTFRRVYGILTEYGKKKQWL